MMSPERARQIKQDLEGEELGPMRHIDKDGRLIPLWQWAVLFENESYRIVEQTRIWPGISISTIWLGLDHGFAQGRPLFFETMVFSSGNEDLYQKRWSDLTEAKTGHQLTVAEWKIKRFYWLIYKYLVGPILRIFGRDKA